MHDTRAMPPAVTRCPHHKVPSEVQAAMQQSLDSAAIRKKKKQKLAEEVGKLNPPDPTEAENAMQMIPMSNMLDTGAATLQMVLREESTPKVPIRGRRKAAKHTPLSPPGSSCPPSEAYMQSNEPNPGPIIDTDQVYMAIGRFLYEAGVPLDAVNSVYFQPMVDAIASAGPGLQLPSYHDFRGCILKRSVEDVNTVLEHYKASWIRTGCSILADEWTTATGKTLIKFFVYCPEGMMYLKSVDASHIVTSPDTLYELLKHAVEEVGEGNVVQVITSNTEIHAAAGKKLMETFPTLFWTPCASQCIDAMLEDIVKLGAVSEVIETAKSVTGFIYNNGPVLNMMRKYTHGKDLLLPSESRAATNFITLKRMICMRDELTSMVSSEEWADCPYYNKSEGNRVASLIQNFSFWSSCETIVRITEPLLRVLKLVDSNKRPAMGYIYAAMYQAKEVIKRELVKKTDYMIYWSIIDWRWDRQLPRPLHAAGFFLNPRFFYSLQVEVSNEISSAVLDCIERLVPDLKVQDKIQKELGLYKSSAGDFGRKMAIRASHTLFPAEWWSTYGGACPNLTRLAIRILSQTCSARGCDKNHIPFEQIHNQRMNSLEHQRLCNLVFVRYNLRLQQRQLLKSKPFDPISVDNIDIVDDWVVERSELLSGEDAGTSWMVLNQPVTDGTLPEYANDDDTETFIAGIDENAIRAAGQDAEDDDEIKVEGA